MSTIQLVRNRLKEFKESINPIIKETFDDNELVIVNYQTDEQLSKGKNSKGVSIRPAYTRLTISIKKKKGQPFDRVTWKDTGELYKNIKVNTTNDQMEITTSVEYAEKLIIKYGDDTLGIQEEFLKDFLNKYILPNLKKEADDKLTKP